MAAETDIPRNLSDLDLERTKFLVNGTRKLARIASRGMFLGQQVHSVDFEAWAAENDPKRDDDYDVRLEIPDFYAELAPREIAIVEDLMGFPVPGCNGSSSLTRRRKYWATSLLHADVTRGATSHDSTVAIQAGQHAFFRPGHLREIHGAQGGRPADGPSVLRSVILKPIIEFGKTLDEDVAEWTDAQDFLDKLP